MSIPHAGKWRTRVQYAAISLAVLMAAELFLRLILSGTIEKSEWFSAGIHTPHSEHGFVLTPDYEGHMRHADQVYLTPLRLDGNGFRVEAKHPESAQDVLMLGGRSMMFSYGLTDEHALHKRVGESLRIPATVRNAAWPGFELARNFAAYQSVSDLPAPDFTVISFFAESKIDFCALVHPECAGGNSTEPQHEDLFYFYDDLVVAKPSDVTGSAFGRLFQRSIVAHKLTLYLRQIVARIPGLTGASALQPAPISAETAAHGRTRFGELTAQIQEHFGGRDKVLFVALPGRNLGVDHYDALTAALPHGAHVLDLNRHFGAQTRQSGYIAHGHYSSQSAAFLGRKIAERINEIQLR